MYNNLGNKVSRVLDAEDHSFSSLVFQPLKPPLDSEWNLMQAVLSDTQKTLLTNTHQNGFLNIGSIVTRPEGGSAVWKNAFKFSNPLAFVNGWVVRIGGGTNQFPSGSTDNIWKLISGSVNEVAYILGPGPSAGHRDDLVFLEVWEELIQTNSQIYKYGFVQSGLTSFSNDLIDPNISQETSLRTQVRYRIRSAEGIDFSSFREGVNHPSVFAQGAKSTPNSGYKFLKSNKGHYVSGNGNAQSSTDLGTVDGYVYALPLFAIHRKNLGSYSNLNTNGAGVTMPVSSSGVLAWSASTTYALNSVVLYNGTVYVSLTNGNLNNNPSSSISNWRVNGVSDRPDGAFQDEISFNDIEDLRHLLVLDDDLEKICDESFADVISGTPDRLERGMGTTTNLFSKVDLQIDGISVTDRTSQGISGSFLRQPNGIQRSFSDREITQRTVIFVASGSVDGNGNLNVLPPVFYGLANTDNNPDFNNFNPFIGSATTPVVINANSGAVITPDTTQGISGWTNLGDKLGKGPALFRPLNPIDVTGVPLMIEYDLVIPSGSGLTNVPREVFTITDDVLNFPVGFTVDNQVKTVELSREIHDFVDSSLFRPVSSYQNPSTITEKFRAGAWERTYNVPGNGTNSIIIPTTIDNVAVMSVLRVQNAANELDIPLGLGVIPKVSILVAGGGFKITFNNFNPATTDTVKVTLLMTGTLCEVSTFNKGVNNFARTYVHTIVSTGASSYTINLNGISGINHAEYIYALAGLFELGTISKAYCYTATSPTAQRDLTKIDTVTFGYDGTGKTVTINFVTPPAATKSIFIPMLISFAPLATGPENQYTVTYNDVPYNGFTTFVATPQTNQPRNSIEAEIIYVSEKALVTTSGTGGNVNFSPEDMVGVSTRLPLNDMDRDYTLQNNDLKLNHSSNAEGSVKFADYYYKKSAETKTLEIGDTLLISKVAQADPKYMARGGSLTLPLISYGVEDILTRVDEDVSDQVYTNGSTYNSTFKVENKIMSVLGTECPSMKLLLSGLAVFTQGQITVAGTDGVFTKQLKAGFYIRPLNGNWYQIKRILNDNLLELTEPFADISISAVSLELFLPDMNFIANGTKVPLKDIAFVDGNTGTILLQPSASYLQFAGSHQNPTFSVRYRTATNTMNVLYGLAVGRGYVNAGRGTLSFTVGSINVVGVNAQFTTQVLPGYSIRAVGQTLWYKVAKVIDDDHLQIEVPFLGLSFVATPPPELDADGDTDGPIVDPNAIVPGSFEVLNPEIANELLLFTLTTTSNIDIIDTVSTNTYNLLKQGSANKLIFNNNLDTTSVEGFQANRVVVAADLFYTKNRRLKVNQKV